MVAAVDVLALRPEDLLARSAARARSPSVLSEMAREHEPALRAFALRLSKDDQDARDLVQDTMERALRRIDSFTPGTHPRAWLFSILHNAFVDRCRRRTNEPRGPCADEIELAADEPREPPRWTSIEPEQVAAAIAQLEPEFRAVYELHVEGLAYQDIGRRLGLQINTVGTRLARARKKLRALLDPGAEGEGDA